MAPPATPGGSWNGHVIYNLQAAGFKIGFPPPAGVVFDGRALFGTSYSSGDFSACVDGCGVAFELTPPVTPGYAWTATAIHVFGEQPGDGAGVQAALTVGPGGVLYGTTSYGGSGTCSTDGGALFGCGTVFQLTPPATPGGTWTESVLYSFTGLNDDGAYPVASVVVGKNGALYGTTQHGGNTTSDSICPSGSYSLAGCGTVFKLTPPTTPGAAWTETVLHSFSGQNDDGSMPVAGLALSATGLLYGTTSAGGASGKGTVFVIKP